VKICQQEFDGESCLDEVCHFGDPYEVADVRGSCDARSKVKSGVFFRFEQFFELFFSYDFLGVSFDEGYFFIYVHGCDSTIIFF